MENQPYNNQIIRVQELFYAPRTSVNSIKEQYRSIYEIQSTPSFLFFHLIAAEIFVRNEYKYQVKRLEFVFAWKSKRQGIIPISEKKKQNLVCCHISDTEVW